MTLDLYAPGSSVLHRLSPGVKILVLMFCGTGLFVVESLALSTVALVVAASLYRVAGFPARTLFNQIRPIWWILAILLVAQGLFNSWTFGLFLVLRLTALLLLAGLVTLTTRSSDMISALERGLAFLRPIGVNPAKVGLAFALALRFIPVLAQATQEVREAQKARGLEGSVLATAIPVAVRTLKMGDEIAQAIDARGWDS